MKGKVSEIYHPERSGNRIDGGHTYGNPRARFLDCALDDNKRGFLERAAILLPGSVGYEVAAQLG